MAFMYGQSRIFFVMARDGLLPQRLSAVHPRFGTPVLMTMITGIIVAAIAAFLPLQRIAEVANAGTLTAFIAVSVCMIVMQMRVPQHERIFGPVSSWVIGLLAIGGCAYLFFSLPSKTIYFFFTWNAAGLLVYLLWARRKSVLALAPEAT